MEGLKNLADIAVCRIASFTSAGLTDYSQVDSLELWYKFVNFRAEMRTRAHDCMARRRSWRDWILFRRRRGRSTRMIRIVLRADIHCDLRKQKYTR